jgi:hypothetical protein
MNPAAHPWLLRAVGAGFALIVAFFIVVVLHVASAGAATPPPSAPLLPSTTTVPLVNTLAPVPGLPTDSVLGDMGALGTGITSGDPLAPAPTLVASIGGYGTDIATAVGTDVGTAVSSVTGALGMGPVQIPPVLSNPAQPGATGVEQGASAGSLLAPFQFHAQSTIIRSVDALAGNAISPVAMMFSPASTLLGPFSIRYAGAGVSGLHGLLVITGGLALAALTLLGFSAGSGTSRRLRWILGRPRELLLFSLLERPG